MSAYDVEAMCRKMADLWLARDAARLMASVDANAAGTLARDAADAIARLTAALAESEARRVEAERERDDRKWMEDGGTWEDRAKAAESSLAAAVEVLRQVEWEGDSETCPACHSWPGHLVHHGHRPDCALASALATGGGASRASRERSGR